MPVLWVSRVNGAWSDPGKLPVRFPILTWKDRWKERDRETHTPAPRIAETAQASEMLTSVILPSGSGPRGSHCWGTDLCKHQLPGDSFWRTPSRLCCSKVTYRFWLFFFPFTQLLLKSSGNRFSDNSTRLLLTAIQNEDCGALSDSSFLKLLLNEKGNKRWKLHFRLYILTKKIQLGFSISGGAGDLQ